MNKFRILSSVALISTLGAVVYQPTPNFTDYEQRAINSLFELANLTTHIPESFVLNKKSSPTVIKQMSVFET